MKRSLLAVVSTGVLALGLSVPSQASASAACSYYAQSPFRDSSDTVFGQGGGSGSCATVNMNLKRQRTGPDQVLAHTDRSGAGNMVINKSCDWSGTYGVYIEVYGSQDSTVYAPVAPGTIQIDCISP